MINYYLEWEKFFEEAIKLEVPDFKAKEKLIYLGIGGSGIPGRLLQDLGIDVRIYRGFHAKSDVNTSALVVSYSGTTTETITALMDVLRQGYYDIVVITSDGHLEKIAKEKNLKLVKIPKGLQTRYSFPYIFTTLIKLVNNALGLGLNVTELKDGVSEGKERYVIYSKELAEKINGKIPVFYSNDYVGVAERFKQELNENAKYPAFYDELPEANHNEIESYAKGRAPLLPIILGLSEINDLTAEVINAIRIKPLFTRPLKIIPSLLLLAGLTSLELAQRLSEDPEKLYLIPQIRSKTSSLLKV